MSSYIKSNSNILRSDKCKTTLVNSRNRYILYTKNLPNEFLFTDNPPSFIETINFSLGTNLHTKPYKKIL
jgi:hypothetical protein